MKICLSLGLCCWYSHLTQAAALFCKMDADVCKAIHSGAGATAKQGGCSVNGGIVEADSHTSAERLIASQGGRRFGENERF